jgi:hypothetical protein
MTICPTCDEEGEGTFCEHCRTNLITGAAPPKPPSEPEPAVQPAVGPEPATDEPPPPVVLEMTADRSHYERMVDDDQRQDVVFPEGFEARHLELTGEQVSLGRVSPGRPVDVDIAFTGEASDPGVSHRQCVFERDGDGWTVQDGDTTEGSTNGIYVNDRTVRLTPAESYRLTAGDRIYIGAWTCLTVT